MKKYTIRAVLQEEANQGWIWQGECPSRTTIKVSHSKNGKQRSVYCQARKIDRNFLDLYNQSKEEKDCLRKSGKKPRIDIHLDRAHETMVMSEWYRDALGHFETTKLDKETGLDDKTDFTELSIIAYDSGWKRLWGPIRAAAHHPDIIVRIGISLGVLGAILGFIALVPTILDIAAISKSCQWPVVLVVALIAILLGYLACRRPSLIH